MLSSKRKCRSTWNIPSWHPLSLQPKLRSLWPILSPVCRGEGSHLFVPTYMELRSAWQLHFSGPLWGPFSSICKTMAQLLQEIPSPIWGPWSKFTPFLCCDTPTTQLWYSSFTGWASESASHQSLTAWTSDLNLLRSQRCGARIQTQPTLLVTQATLQQLKWEHQHIFLHSSTF